MRELNLRDLHARTRNADIFVKFKKPNEDETP